MYSYAILDRRSTREAGGQDGQIAAARYVLGIDVQPAALAELCHSNITPHRRGGRVITAMIELAQTWSLPRPGSLLVAVRAKPGHDRTCKLDMPTFERRNIGYAI